MPTEPRTSPRRQVARLTPAAGMTIVAALVAGVLAIRVFSAAHRPLSWAAAALVVAVFLDPIVDRISARIRRFPAVLLCFLVAGTVVVGTAYMVFDDLDQAMRRLEVVAPEAADRIEARDDGVGQVSRDLRLAERIDDAVAGLRGRVGSGGEVIRSTALTAPAYLVGAILTVFLMSYGPRIGAGALQQLPEERRRGVGGTLTRAADRARSAALLTLADALVVGALVTGVASLLDLPAPAALGVLAAVFAILPHLGIVLGSLPLILLALGLSSGLAAAVIAVGAIALQAFDSLFVRKRIDRSVHLGLLAPWVVVLLANDVYGVGAAAYGLAYALFGLAVLDELSADDRPSDGDTPGALAASPA